MDYNRMLRLFGVDYASWCGIIGGILLFTWVFYSYTIKTQLFIEGLDKDDRRRNVIVRPVVLLHHVFNKIFGSFDGNFLSSLNIRSVFIVFILSVSSNLLFVFSVLYSCPESVSMYSVASIRVLMSSYIVYLLSCFVADILSVSCTRYFLFKIVKESGNIVRYGLANIACVVASYVLAMSPVLIVLIISSCVGGEVNKYLEIGVLGPVIIPFFMILFIFGRSPVPVKVFSIISIASFFIPTASYVLIMLLWVFTYKLFADRQSDPRGIEYHLFFRVCKVLGVTLITYATVLGSVYNVLRIGL